MASIADEIANILSDDKIFKAVSDQAFVAIDLDGSGYIEYNELEAAMKSMAEDVQISPPTPEEVQKALVNLDKDSNGMIDKEEFRVLMRKVLTIMARDIK